VATSIAERIRAAVLTRLKTPSAIVRNIRRSHLIDIERDAAPAIYVFEGNDLPVEGAKNCTRRRMGMMVRIAVRSDSGTTACDPYLLAVLARLDPAAAGGYGAGVMCSLGAIAPNQEVADKDVCELDIDLVFMYDAANEWQLTA